ncbi:type II toxin-antitoxin system HipA family toxin [Prosthecomicrobium hirschii]|uniref:type II toxin-antitoxin system HipA family toxin n=1 Tax=Prosthecodimorpha hirschii TaxID=665126 RepID=UPI00221FE702|nr:type II toxin-antitoxin system HipA family toxin [Prosthecomicrobium hirschii]
MRVHFESRVVGTLDAGPVFTYEPGWLSLRGAFPVSTRMPLAAVTYGPETVAPFIANLLPESDPLVSIGRVLGTAPQDAVGLLDRIGRDTAGALSFGLPGSTAIEYRAVPTVAALERIIEELPAKPFLAGEDGVSISLAGAQSKMGVFVDDGGAISIPIRGSPSNVILKPDIPRLHGSVENEAFCLVLAGLCGLAAPRVRIGRAGRRRTLLVDRYDRIRQGDAWRRLHQEDVCQALGLPPALKYERNGTGIRGPGLADLFAVVRRTCDARSLLALIDLVIFNVLVGNTDAHAKNYSILIGPAGNRLAPAYDLMASAIWPSITRNMAMAVAGKTRGEHLCARHWRRQAEAVGLNGARLLARVEALAGTILDRMDDAVAAIDAMTGGPEPVVRDVAAEIGRRTRMILDGLRASDDEGPSEDAADPADV